MVSRIRRPVWLFSCLALLSVGLWQTTPALAQPLPSVVQPVETRESAIVNGSAAVLNDVMKSPGRGIPRNLLADAHGLVVIPSVVKGGFVVGVRHGRGVALVRDEQNRWHAPQFVSLTGGSVGFQVGLQATDLILVFRTRRSIEGLLQGKFTIGADAAAAAGPVGRQAAVATDAQLKAEIFSYSRSRGLFAGVSLDGSVLEIDHRANALYYPSVAPGQPSPLPSSATRLMQLVAQYSEASTTLTPAEPTPVEPTPAESTPVERESQRTPTAPAENEADALRKQLLEATQTLHALLDEQWQRFLAMPADLYNAQQPSQASLAATLKNFEQVSSSPQYTRLSQRSEFQRVHALLKRYIAATSETDGGTLQLPPPPNQTGPRLQ